MTKHVAGRGAGDEPGTRQGIHSIRIGLASETGLALGTEVLTLEGEMPVEYLTPGDRVVTRSGARILRALQSVPARGPLLRVAPGTLGHDRPEKALLLGGQAKILMRGWRAQAMFGARTALVDLARLEDGVNVTRVAPEGTRLFTLHFDAPEVIYAEGVELGAEMAKLTV